MSKKEKAASALFMAGAGGIGAGSTLASKSSSDDVSENLPNLILPEVQPYDNTPLPKPQNHSQPSSTRAKPKTIKDYVSPGPFGTGVKGVAGAQHGGNTTDYRVDFAPNTVYFNTVTRADIYFDLEYYKGSRASKSWFDSRMELSIKYHKNRGLYVYTYFGNQWDGNVLGQVTELHKIVYLEEKDGEWTIDQGFLYSNISTPDPHKPVKIMYQNHETYDSLATIVIDNLCSTYRGGCGKVQPTGINKLSAHYELREQNYGYWPFNPFRLRDQVGMELSAGWKEWFWQAHQSQFTGFYDKNHRGENKWKIPRWGMRMGWSSVYLLRGSGYWNRKCFNDKGISCGMNTYEMARYVASSG